MSQSPHRILAKLAANERRKREQQLANLQRRRNQFRETCETIGKDIVHLSQQRGDSMGHGTAAAGLVSINCAIEEKRALTIFIEQQITQLQVEEKQLVQCWNRASVKEKAHDKANDKIVRQQQRRQDLHSEQQMGDLCATSSRSRIAMERE
ncbi:MAG: hypothetical protein R8J85_02050 [Mariprofundales bacterium]